MRFLHSLRRQFSDRRRVFPPSLLVPEKEVQQMLKKQNPLLEEMKSKLLLSKFLRFEDYWREALTNTKWGYYSDKNVFSSKGDFVTSPQISTLFGVTVAVWIVHFFQQRRILDASFKLLKRFRLVELGGGRGRLIEDILSLFKDCKLVNGFELNFIEVSQYNRKEQQRKVMDAFKKVGVYFEFNYKVSNAHYEEFNSEDKKQAVKLAWYLDLDSLKKNDEKALKGKKEVPFTLFYMNEFFDALPPTLLQYTPRGWREKRFVLSGDDSTFPLHLELSPQIYSPEQFPIHPENQVGESMEVNRQSERTMKSMAQMIEATGGAILNIDYGELGSSQESVRGIYKHKFVPIPELWQLPGVCDLSVNVDFMALSFSAEEVSGIRSHSLMTQGMFLESMGINQLAERNSKKKSEEFKNTINGEKKRLIDQDQMGKLYKVQLVTLEEYGEVYPFISEDENSIK